MANFWPLNSSLMKERNPLCNYRGNPYKKCLWQVEVGLLNISFILRKEILKTLQDKIDKRKSKFIEVFFSLLFIIQITSMS